MVEFAWQWRINSAITFKLPVNIGPILKMLVPLYSGFYLSPFSKQYWHVAASKFQSIHLGNGSGHLMEKQAFKMHLPPFPSSPGGQEQTQASPSRVSINVW